MALGTGISECLIYIVQCFNTMIVMSFQTFDVCFGAIYIGNLPVPLGHQLRSEHGLSFHQVIKPDGS